MRLLDVGCGWGGMVRHAARHYGVRGGGHHRVGRAGPLGSGSRRGRRPGRPGRDPPPGLPRRARRALRRHQLDRHVRTRRAELACASTSAASTTCWRPVVGCSTTPSADRPTRASASTPAASWAATCSPTASSSRSVRSSPSCSRWASRPDTSRTSASTTPSPCGPGWPTSRPTGTRPWRLVGEARARIWRLYLAGCAVNFDDGATAIHQVLGVKLDQGRSGLPLRPRWERLSLSRWGVGADDPIVLV